MSVVTKGYTFGATETVTNVKLHTLVDSATVTSIVNSDIDGSAAIAETKISFDGSTAVIDTGAQTIAGVKTFTSFPVTPSSAPTTNYMAANKKYVDDECDNRCPVGSMRMWFTGTAPTDWLLCDGAAVSRATYADLYGVIADTAFRYGYLSTRTDDNTGIVTLNGGGDGITDSATMDVLWDGGSRIGMTILNVSGGAISLDEGTGDNLPTLLDTVWCRMKTETFFTPDMRGRFPACKDNLGGTSADRMTVSEADTIGMAEGNEVILESQMPSHNHALTAEGGSGVLGPAQVADDPTSHDPQTIYTAEAGSDGGYWQPFLTVGYIIRT